MKSRKTLIAVIALIVAVVLAAGAWMIWKPTGIAGSKAIVVEVITDDSAKEYKIKTDSENLRGALEEAELVGGEESEYGLFVHSMAGITADDAKQQWWCFTKGGEDLFTGVDDTPIADGDHFEATLMTGWADW
ncbi:MAG: DUF4430 domain-containing protein [Oscillospiraceae bacterium]|nr:DUF4430 domain-containing protein [Oscillospiraceae bacterium]